MKRHLLSVFAVAAFASFAGAQQPPMDSTHARADSTMHKVGHEKANGTSKVHGMKHMSDSSRAKHTSTSGGEVDVSRGGAGYSMHATSRDMVGADDTKGDALFRREQMMDSKCGKSREHCGKP